MHAEYASLHGVPAHEDLVQRLAAARGRLAGVAHVTSVHTSRQLDEACGARVFLKCENLQRVGAFKFRGAWNFLTAMAAGDRARGVIAYSSGNHAQAVACAARLHAVPCVVVMPSTASPPKLAATRDYGAEIVHHDLLGEPREVLAARLAHARGLTLVPPFDHPEILVGQGTAVAELLDSHGPLDAVLVPVGGGGLLAGSALAAAVHGGRTRVIGVEPAAGDDAARALAAGRLVRIEPPDTICDGARTQQISELTLALLQRYAAGVVTVHDARVVEAMYFAYERLKLVVEPTGALGLAALLSGAVRLPGQRVGVILSGGNVDAAQAGRWFASLRAHASQASADPAPTKLGLPGVDS
jgi:threonine dehydratase